ncbi:MAG: SDR family oxidoreductase [Solirubrobacteraceae bacterium]|nr:SDR family oxidoreductase [Solirubrobacteraceae bacterium]
MLARLIPRRVRVLCAIRARNDAHAGERLDETLRRLWRSPPARARRQLRAVACDLEAGPMTLAGLDEVTHVLHAAAAIGFEQSIEQARSANVGGTRAVLGLARRAPRLQRVVHVSTAYVAGTWEGSFAEDDLDVGQGFRNTYERSKLEAELLVREAARDLPVVVARPSIVMGESRTGWTTSFNVLYPLLRAYRRGLVARVPADPDGYVDIVTGDYVADGLVHLLLDAPTADGAYNLVSGRAALTVALLRDLAAATLGLPPIELDAERGRTPEGIGVLGPYLGVRTRFDDRRARAALRPAGIEPTAPVRAFGALMSYAERAAWGKRPQTRADATAMPV